MGQVLGPRHSFPIWSVWAVYSCLVYKAYETEPHIHHQMKLAALLPKFLEKWYGFPA